MTMLLLYIYTLGIGIAKLYTLFSLKLYSNHSCNLMVNKNRKVVTRFLFYVYAMEIIY